MYDADEEIFPWEQPQQLCTSSSIPFFERSYLLAVPINLAIGSFTSFVCALRVLLSGFVCCGALAHQVFCAV